MRALMVALAVLLLAGCTDTTTPAEPRAAVPSALGGQVGTPAVPPGRPMSLAERTIADDLSRRLEAQGLSVDYLECPDLEARRSVRGTCHGYLDGVVAEVRVRLWGPPADRHYDARLGRGILATSNLVRRLAAEGYHRVDCGERHAYPSVVGHQIVCRVSRSGREEYVVATVTTERGEVRISDY